MRGFTGSWAILRAAVLLLPVLSGCVGFSMKTTGAATVADLQAENEYIAVYMDYMTRAAEDIKLFQPNGNSPGPCDKGGNAQQCLSADLQLIATFDAMLNALDGTNVPPRYVEADRLLRDALAKNINGLELRNQAIQKGDNTLWNQHTAVLRDAQTAWSAAYAAFPADNKPPLGP